MEDDMLRSLRAHASHQRAALAALKGEKHKRWNLGCPVGQNSSPDSPVRTGSERPLAVTSVFIESG